MIPVRLAFYQEIDDQWQDVDYVMDALFFLDLGFSFMTAIEGDSGELITDYKLIAKQYLRSWFLVDFLACAPTGLMVQWSGLDADSLNNSSTPSEQAQKFIKLAKLPRLYRVLKLVKLLKFLKSNKRIQK
jgi:hypothetical protein